MKRFIPLVLALALFAAALAGCVNTPVSTPTPTPKPTPAPTATATPSAGVQRVYLPGGALPKESYEPLALPVRFYEDVTKTFIPSKEYGHIWPYVGAFLSAMMGRTQFFGLCDDKGRIICDPVFHKVDVLEKDGAKLYQLIEYTANSERRYRKIAKITLAKPDGSWALECDELYTVSAQEEYPLVDSKDDSKKWITWRKDSTLEYITIRKGDKWGAIDYKGNEILPCSYSAPLFFSEGLAAVISDDGKKIYYIDSAGRAIIGPYQRPPKQDNSWQDFSSPLPDTYALSFSEGKVRFYQDGKFGVVDKSGKILVPAKYDYISSYYEDTAVFMSGGKYGVLGVNGEIITEASDTKPTNLADSRERSFYELRNGNFVRTANGNTAWQIVNPSGETVAGPFNGLIEYYSRSSIENYNLILVELGRAEYGMMWDYRFYTVYDETGKRLLPDEYLSIQPFDGRFLVRTETAAGLMEEGGSWVIRVPLYDYMKD